MSKIKICLAFVFFFLFATILYCHDESNLSGEWLLDDRGTVTMNPVVKEEVPWIEVWNRDFWGQDQLTSDKSHKSWRPIVTASYRLNYFWTRGISSEDAYWFHLTDRILHGLVTALTFPVAALTFRQLCILEEDVKGALSFFEHPLTSWPWFWGGSTLVALLYGAHPIHVESVANTTGRAEVLCAIFYFLGFLAYAKLGAGVSLTQHDCGVTSFKSILGVSVLILFTWTSMLCKEHGITLPLMCIIWDAYVGTSTSITELKNVLKRDTLSSREVDNRKHLHPRNHQCRLFLLRSLLCLLGLLSLAFWRLSKNGDSPPEFVCEQNPTACEPNRLIRFLSFSFLWCFNFWLMLYPDWLCPDWSGDSIKLIRNPATDNRLPALFLLWGVLIAFIYHSFYAAIVHPPTLHNSVEELKSGKETKAQVQETYLYHIWMRTIITSFCWMLLPFLMSSNLLVYVGFVVADRTLYLPSFGFCLLLVLCLVYIIITQIWDKDGSTHFMAKNQILFRAKVIVTISSMFILGLYTVKQQAQTKRWSHPVLLWGKAFEINPNSFISGKEYGMSLVNSGRNKDAAQILSIMHNRENPNDAIFRTISGVRDKQKGNTHTPLQDKISKMSRIASILETKFTLATALENVAECEKSITLSEEGLLLAEESLSDIELEVKKAGTVEIQKGMRGASIDDVKNSLIRNKAFLYVAMSKCAHNVETMNYFATEAVKTDQMEYTVENLVKVTEIVQNVHKLGLDLDKVLMSRTLNSDGQTSQLNFAASQ